MSNADVKIVCLVGMPGAGKSSCVSYLEQKGWPSVYFGGVTIDEVKARGLEVNETNERTVREDIRAKEGIGAVAIRIIPKIDALAAAGNQIIIADGLYGWTEYKILKEKYGNSIITVAITAPRSVRHERLAHRPVRPLTDEQATAREYAEIENMEKGGPIANADYTIVNETDVADLTSKLEHVLHQAGVL